MNEQYLATWLQLPEQDKKEILTQTAVQKGLPVYAIEKDWWVVQALSAIFSMEYAQAFIFKGGTSLSKGWNLIERFSEDIDLALDREFLGFAGELTKNNIKKLRKRSYEFITEQFVKELKHKFTNMNLGNVSVIPQQTQNQDQDPSIIEIYYPAVIQKDNYLKPSILVEIGCRSLKEPFTKRAIQSAVSEVFPEQTFADKAIYIPVVNPERTFLEKIFLLHEEFQKRKEKIRTNRLSRHLYDIEVLSRTRYAELALEDRELFDTIVKHRSTFTPISGIDYTKHEPRNISIIPPESIMHQWEQDYGEMKETMIYDPSLSFNELIKKLCELQNRINNIA